MAQFPARRSGHDVATADPYREFEDIYDRMGQLVNAAFLGGQSPGTRLAAGLGA
jgi:hypothetical protein